MEDADAVPLPGVRGDDGAHRGGAARARLHAPQAGGGRRREGGDGARGAGAAGPGAQGRGHHGRRRPPVLHRRRQRQDAARLRHAVRRCRGGRVARPSPTARARAGGRGAERTPRVATARDDDDDDARGGQFCREVLFLLWSSVACDHVNREATQPQPPPPPPAAAAEAEAAAGCLGCFGKKKKACFQLE